MDVARAGRPALWGILVAGIVVAACQSSSTVSPIPSGSSSSAEPSASLAASASAEPSVAAGPLEIDWAEQPFDGTVTAVTVDRGQFVAVGGNASSLASWTSADGASWATHPVAVPTPVQLNLASEPFFIEYLQNPAVWPPMMGPMARFGDSLLSFGTLVGPADGRRPLGWRTTDTVTWEFVESANEFFTDGYVVVDLVGSGAELVALNTGFAQPSGGTWRWTPDTSWVQTTPGGTDYTQSGLSLIDAVWADGQFVAVGQASLGQTAASWVSPTGQSWLTLFADPALVDGVMRAVALAPGGAIVAVGNLSGTPTAWTSADGLSWSSVSLPGGGNAEVHGLAPLGVGLLAIGSAGGNTQTWTSRDGTAWLVGPTLAGSMYRDAMAAAGSTVVLFLVQGTEPDRQTVRWLGQIQP